MGRFSSGARAARLPIVGLSLMAALIGTGVSSSGVAAAPAPVRVEDAAVSAVVALGEGAPAAVLESLDEGTTLPKVVRQIQRDKLTAAEEPSSVGLEMLTGITIATYQAAGKRGDDLTELLFSNLEAQALRERAAETQAQVVGEETMTADPVRVLEEAARHDADPAAVMLVLSILMAANNGYDAGQITDFLIDQMLDPGGTSSPSEEQERYATGFVFGGVLGDVEPSGPATDDVFKESRANSSTPSAGGAADHKPPTGTFVGTLAQTGDWASIYKVATPALSESRVKLLFKDGRLVGTFSALLPQPQEGGICSSSMAFDGTIELARDGTSYRGLATGTQSVAGNGRAGCPGDQTVPGNYWDVTVTHPRGGALSGTMDWQSHPGLGFTITAHSA